MKYIQLYAIDKDSVTMPQHWRNHLVNKDGYKILNNGPYNWIKVFKGYMAWSAGLPLIELDTGEIKDIRELEDTIFHIHLNGENFELINTIKAISPNTKILTSVDYSMNIWSQAIGFFTIDHLINVVNLADYAFSTEDKMAQVLTEFSNKDVPCIPHPYNIDEVAEYKSTSFSDPKECIVMLHEQDDRDFYQAHLALKNMPLKTHALNVADHLMNRLNGVVFNKISPYTGFEFMIKPIKWIMGDETRMGGFLPKAFMAYDSYGHRVTGRWQTDCAALGIPCIGTDNAMMQKILFPELTTEFYDIQKQRKLISQLLEDADFYRCIHENCQRRLKSFGMEVSKKRMENFIQGKSYHDFKEGYLVDSYRAENTNIVKGDDDD